MIRKLLGMAVLAAGVSATPSFAKPQTQDSATANPKDKVVCKTFLETGSLVKSYRTCKTLRQWQFEREVAREKGEQMTTHITTEQGN